MEKEARRQHHLNLVLASFIVLWFLVFLVAVVVSFAKERDGTFMRQGSLGASEPMQVGVIVLKCKGAGKPEISLRDLHFVEREVTFKVIGVGDDGRTIALVPVITEQAVLIGEASRAGGLAKGEFVRCEKSVVPIGVKVETKQP